MDNAELPTEDNPETYPRDSQPFGLREPRPYHFIPRPPTPPSPTLPTPDPSIPASPPPPPDDDNIPDDLTPEQERHIDLILQALDRQIRLNPVLSRQAAERTPEQELFWRARMVGIIMEEIAKKSRLNDSLSARRGDVDDGRDSSATAQDTGEDVSRGSDDAQDQAQAHWHPMNSRPFHVSSRDPQQPYHFIPQPPAPRRSIPAPAPAQSPVDDTEDIPPQTFNYTTLEEAKSIRMEESERRYRLNASLSARASDDRRNRATTGQGIGPGKDASRGARDDAENKAAREDPGERYRREVYNGARMWWTGLSRRTRLAIKWIPASTVVGTLGWKFWHSQLGGELFTEIVAGGEALKVVDRGLMGVAASMARGAWAVMKHCGRHPKQYAAIGVVYGSWLKGKLHVLGQVLVVVLFLVAAGCWHLVLDKPGYVLLIFLKWWMAPQ